MTGGTGDGSGAERGTWGRAHVRSARGTERAEKKRQKIGTGEFKADPPPRKKNPFPCEPGARVAGENPKTTHT